MNIRHKIAAAALTAIVAVPVVTAVSTGTAQALPSHCSAVMKADTGDVICRGGIGQFRARILVAADDGSYGYYAYGPWRNAGGSWSTARARNYASEHVIGITIQKR